MVTGRIGFRIFERENILPQALLEQFKPYSTCNVGDAMGRFRVMGADIGPVVPTRRIVGRAVTVLVRSVDNLMMHKAMAMAGPGDIVVVDTYGAVDASGWGALMTRSAVKAGFEGIVIDGSARDLEELRELGFPVYARAVTARGCFKDGPGEINCNICCGGVSVSPGDLIVADEDGVACVPFADAEYVLEATKKLVAGEAARIKEIEDGIVFKPAIDETLRARGVIR